LNPATQTADLALALALIGRHHHFRAEHTEAIAALEQARALAEPLDDPRALLWIYSALSGAYQHLCDFERSDEWARTCIALGERRGLAAAICVGHEMMAENAGTCGHWAAAQEHARIDREIGERIGDQDRVAWASYSQALALAGQGQLAQAEAEALAGLALALRIGDERVACWLEPLLAIVLAEQGRHAEAQERVASALAHADALGQLTLRLIALHAAIVVASRRGDIRGAADQAALFMEGAQASESRMAYVYGGAAAAEALLNAGDLRHATDFVEEFLAFTANRAPHPHAVALSVRGQIRAAQGDLAGARTDLDAAIVVLEALGSKLALARVLRAREDLFPG
jgi:tetratricopeptide (TPR) repeat protein